MTDGLNAGTVGPYRRRCCEAADGSRRHLGGRGAQLEPVLLAALARSEAHGYDLARLIEQMTGGEVAPDTGGLYRLLRRLEAEGAVTSSWQEGEAGPQRREYRLTADGYALLGHWMDHLVERRDALDRVIAAAREALEASGAAGRERASR